MAGVGCRLTKADDDLKNRLTLDSLTDGAQSSNTPIWKVRVSQMIRARASSAEAINSQSAQFIFSRRRNKRV